MTRPRDESWRARAPEREGFFQARALGITTLGKDGVGPTRHRPIDRARKGLGLGRIHISVHIVPFC